MLETAPPLPQTAEHRYTLHLLDQGIEASDLSLASNGTVASLSAKTAVSLDARPPDALPRVQVGDAPGAELSLLRTLGVGGMGKVMLAVQRPLQREVAVKLPKSEPASAQVTAELLREALVTGRLEHPNIVPVHLLGRGPDDAPFFVMKRIEGTPWRTLLDEPGALAALGQRAADPLGFHLGVLLEVCDAVSFAHSRGVLHRDLKPDNVMLGRFGEVYVLDWGIAVTTRADPLLPLASESRGVCGTPAYLAPEMAAGDGAALSERTDVYLLGAVLHHVLVGRGPHGGATLLAALTQAWEAKPPTFPASVPDELAALCRRALAKRPEDRFPSVQALRDAVEGFLRRRDSLALAAEAERRLSSLEASLARRRAGEVVAPGSMQVAFTECRFAWQQVRAVPGLEDLSRAGLARALVAMARGELLDENLQAARALASQLEVVPPGLGAELDALAKTLDERKARVAALERLELDADLDLAVSMRSRVALGVAVVGALSMLGVGVLIRLGVMSFAYREAVVGISAFGVVISGVEQVIRRRWKLNGAQRRLLLGNRLALISFVVFWSCAWVMNVAFTAAAAGFMFHVACLWWTATTLFDSRGWPVAVAFSVGAALAVVLPGWQFEVFSAATLAGFGGLGLAWGSSAGR